MLTPPKFVGLDNFKRALSDPYVANALKNSFKYLLVVPAIQLVAFLMALLVNRSLPGISLLPRPLLLPGHHADDRRLLGVEMDLSK